MIRRFKLWWCKTFGHSFDLIDIIVEEDCREDFPDLPFEPIKCHRCGKEFVKWENEKYHTFD